jgi:hypothetical protein
MSFCSFECFGAPNNLCILAYGYLHYMFSSKLLLCSSQSLLPSLL